jgi:tagatose-1,6-bisphosphate aldolase
MGRESGECQKQKGHVGQVVIAMQTENDGVMSGCALWANHQGGLRSHCVYVQFSALRAVQ